MTARRSLARYLALPVLVAGLAVSAVLSSPASADGTAAAGVGPNADAARVAAPKQAATGEPMGQPIVVMAVLLADHGRISWDTQLDLFRRVADAEVDQRRIRLHAEAPADGLVHIHVFRNPFRDPADRAAALSMTADVIAAWSRALAAVATASGRMEQRDLTRELEAIGREIEMLGNNQSAADREQRRQEIRSRLIALEIDGAAAAELVPEIVLGYRDGTDVADAMSADATDGDDDASEDDASDNGDTEE